MIVLCKPGIRGLFFMASNSFSVIISLRLSNFLPENRKPFYLEHKRPKRFSLKVDRKWTCLLIATIWEGDLLAYGYYLGRGPACL